MGSQSGVLDDEREDHRRVEVEGLEVRILYGVDWADERPFLVAAFSWIGSDLGVSPRDYLAARTVPKKSSEIRSPRDL